MVVTPAVSVVLPVHNGHAFIEQSVRSILAQTLADFELVIGNDGSDDGTGDILDRLAAEDMRIRLLRRPVRSGLAGSANWVVSAARAPLVAIAHADDVYHPDRLRRQAELFAKRRDAVLIATLATGIDAQGRVVQEPHLWRLLHASSFAPFSHSSVMFRADAFARTGGYRSGADAWEDLDLYWRMAELGRILVIPEDLAHYRHSSVSIRERHGERIEHALEIMYLSAEAHASGQDWSHLLQQSPSQGRIHPRIFVARSWVRVWSGQRSRMLGRMLRRAALKPRMDSAQSLGFVAWATLSPRSLRKFLQLTGRLRNARARRALGDVEAVEWRLREGDAKLRMGPAAAAARP